VAVVGAGIGDYDCSTDSAILRHLERYRREIGDDVRAFKATEYGGVYVEDPRPLLERGDPMPQRYRSITTGAIRQFGLWAIDQQGVRDIETTRIETILHGYDTDPIQALEGDGTIVRAGHTPTFVLAS
jgi:uridylate kinase